MFRFCGTLFNVGPQHNDRQNHFSRIWEQVPAIPTDEITASALHDPSLLSGIEQQETHRYHQQIVAGDQTDTHHNVWIFPTANDNIDLVS